MSLVYYFLGHSVYTSSRHNGEKKLLAHHSSFTALGRGAPQGLMARKLV